jgi:hypothetical protein
LARFDIINLFDEVYEIRDGTVGSVGAPQFAPGVASSSSSKSL